MRTRQDKTQKLTEIMSGLHIHQVHQHKNRQTPAKIHERQRRTFRSLDKPLICFGDMIIFVAKWCQKPFKFHQQLLN